VAYEVATRLALPLDLFGAELDDASPNLDVENKTVLLVDDGDAARELPRTIEALRVEGATRVIVAVGVASPPIWSLLLAAADHVACLLTPQHIFSIEAWYADLAEPSEAEVRQLLVTATQNLLLLRRSNFLTRNVDT
jgi:predicted phosphoribosyltransferase